MGQIFLAALGQKRHVRLDRARNICRKHMLEDINHIFLLQLWVRTCPGKPGKLATENTRE